MVRCLTQRLVRVRMRMSCSLILTCRIRPVCRLSWSSQHTSGLTNTTHTHTHKTTHAGKSGEMKRMKRRGRSEKKRPDDYNCIARANVVTIKAVMGVSDLRRVVCDAGWYT